MKEKLINVFYLFTPIILGSIVGILISSNIDYEFLIKPPLAPPKVFFPIFWSLIYLLMGISYFLYRKDNNNLLTKIIYYSQLFINLVWSIIFFALKWRFVSIIWIVLLDIVVAYLIYLFYKEKRVSAYLNIFYLIWILFATYLTISIYYLNYL